MSPILKLARTLRKPHRAGDAQQDVADLAGSEAIQTPHLAEALHLRQAEVDDVTEQLLGGRSIRIGRSGRKDRRGSVVLGDLVRREVGIAEAGRCESIARQRRRDHTSPAIGH